MRTDAAGLDGWREHSGTSGIPGGGSLLSRHGDLALTLGAPLKAQ